MPLNARKIIGLTLFIAAIVSSFGMAYSLHISLVVYRAVRTIGVEIEGFDVHLLNETVLTETNVTVINPTQCSFQVKSFAQALYLNSWSEGYIFTGYSYTKELTPFSDSSVTFEISIPAHKMSLLNRTGEKKWLATFHLRVVPPPPGEAVTLRFYNVLS